MTFDTDHFRIGNDAPTYFVADIAANHDGSLERALHLIEKAAAAGANGAKFQHFTAGQIVSDRGFRSLTGKMSHQAGWKKSVFEVYEDASLPRDWTPSLKETCDRCGIDFFSSPYDFDAVDQLDRYVSMYKIGSGDINWTEIVERVARTGKLVMLATGASTIGDVQRAVNAVLRHNEKLVLMQCNTNYTGSLENFRHIHLNVLRTYRSMYPQMVLGLSDHTPGHATVLGAVALGARVIEKHFTDDKGRVGPDHAFSMSPADWKDMVDRTRELENALGSGDKFIAGNETQTAVVQRRCVRAGIDLKAGMVLGREHLQVLRPATLGGIEPSEIERVVGKKLRQDLAFGEHLSWGMLED
ncbi:N-acetylneuraminate synthase family protein [Acidovorax sp.]|uniref:N-acetylneuraminate synthase family protein n=1 Tax=Acidovorax sp. TaxID=1872122 RepID=UPI00391F3241